MNCLELKSVEALLDKGNKTAMRKEFQQSIDFYDQGIDTLGASYDFDGLDDSTDLKLLIACDLQRENDLERAASLKQDILTIRIEIFKQKYTCGASDTSYKLYPEAFEALIEDRSTEFGIYQSLSIRSHALLPPFPRIPESAIVLTSPDRLVVATDDIRTFTWQGVQFPIAFVTMLSRNQQQRIYEQYVHLRDVATGKEFSFLADVQAHDLKKPSAPPLGPEGEYMGSPCTYDIFYFFTQLPLHSAIYDLQVQIADVVSNTRRIDIQLYENDTLLMPAGKELP